MKQLQSFQTNNIQIHLVFFSCVFSALHACIEFQMRNRKLNCILALQATYVYVTHACAPCIFWDYLHVMH